MISTPPVVAPRMKMSAMPAPESTPPNRAASRRSPWYAGKNKAVTSIETESKTVAIIELSRKRQPRNFHAIRKIGTLIAITITPIGVWNRWLSSVAIPLTPPGAI